jgi:CubicO group peptidase (beta-lactamase class C family)
VSDHPRSLPDRPSLRYLKLEAKRRLAAGEFGTLHDAQLAIAREHGRSSWTTLKEHIDAGTVPASLALPQVRWVLSRFQDAGAPAWAAPAQDELREHFDEDYLGLVPPETMTRTLTKVAPRLGDELVVTAASALGVRAVISGMRLEARAHADPPHRLTRLRLYALGQQVSDARVAAPGTRTSGAVPGRAIAVAAESLAELGVPGLALAGGAEAGWVASRGWASLEPERPLDPGDRFPVYAIAQLITSTAVLLLVAAGQVGLDSPANEYLRTVRLADDEVTVRELLSHTGGADKIAEQFAVAVPHLGSLVGPVLPCGGPRGTFAYSNGGYAMLGQLVTDVTGLPFPAAAARLVLEPLAMTGSSFPASWPDTGAITGYRLAQDGTFEVTPREVSALPAAAGLWSTAADLVRFGLGWTSLLPGELAREALRPHATQGTTTAQIGLGWLLNLGKDVTGHSGGGPSAAASLIVAPSDGRVSVALASRLVPIEPVNAGMLRPIG